jgi:hypothetical protein
MTGRAFLVLANAAVREREKACDHCGNRFAKDPRYTWAYWARARYCSPVCTRAAQSAAAEEARPPFEVAFEKWFQPSAGCWNWTGGLDKDGYGAFNYGGKSYRAHLVALKLDGRPVPRGMYGCHTCDNPSCVRPDHLYPGTPTQNMQDAISRGRVRRGEAQHNARLTEDAVRAIRASSISAKKLAAQYGVSRSAVELARNGKTWRHVQ